MSKLTNARRRAMEWIANNEPVSTFPMDGSAPKLQFVWILEADGLVERVGKEPGIFGLTKFSLSSAGRAALAKEGK